MTIQEIAPRELYNFIQGGTSTLIVDVRSPGEFASRHIRGAHNLPLDELSASTVKQLVGANDKVFVVCEGGTRSKRGCEALISQGFTTVVSVAGGTRAWAAEGLPVVIGRGSISIERQVRIVAGALVLLGLFLSWTVSASWAWLSAFVGAGLIFAGVTDTCTMGLLLARLPWNRGQTKSCAIRH